MHKTQRTSKEHPMQWFLFFSLIFPLGLVGIHFFIFLKYFCCIFLQTGITQDGTTKIFTLNRGGMWSTEKQARLLKPVQ